MTPAPFPIAANLAFVCESSVDEYLEALFFGVRWEPGWCVCMRGIGEKGTTQEGDFREDKWAEPAAGDNLIEHVLHHARRWAQHHVAAFVVPAVLSARRGTAENVLLFTHALIDLDSGDTDAKLAFITSHVGPPTIEVLSGGTTDKGTAKRHLYYGFHEPTADIGAVVRLRDSLARKAGGDTSMGLGVPSNPCGRAHQPIRIAGTCHAKNGEARSASLVTASGPRYDL